MPEALTLTELLGKGTIHSLGPTTQQHPVGDLSAILENARIGSTCVRHKHDLSEILI